MTEARGQLLVDAVLTFGGQAFRVCGGNQLGSGMTGARGQLLVNAVLTFGGQAFRVCGGKSAVLTVLG